MTENFNDVLDHGEEIIEEFKPNIFKFLFAAIFTYCVIGLTVAGIATAAILLQPHEGTIDVVYAIIPTIIFFVGFVFSSFMFSVWYKKVWYCYTNRRIIIRCGVFGVYYRCLDLKTIGAIDVSENVFDKMIGKHTGTIRFGSLSSPMVPNSGVYAFTHITEPYETYRRLKDVMDKVKAE